MNIDYKWTRERVARVLFHIRVTVARFFNKRQFPRGFNEVSVIYDDPGNVRSICTDGRTFSGTGCKKTFSLCYRTPPFDASTNCPATCTSFRNRNKCWASFRRRVTGTLPISLRRCCWCKVEIRTPTLSRVSTGSTYLKFKKEKKPLRNCSRNFFSGWKWTRENTVRASIRNQSWRMKHRIDFFFQNTSCFISRSILQFFFFFVEQHCLKKKPSEIRRMEQS